MLGASVPHEPDIWHVKDIELSGLALDFYAPDALQAISKCLVVLPHALRERDCVERLVDVSPAGSTIATLPSADTKVMPAMSSAEPAAQQGHGKRRGCRGGRPISYDAADHKNRNVIERRFCHLKQWRGLATRYDKLATTYRSAPSSSTPSSHGHDIYQTRPSRAQCSKTAADCQTFGGHIHLADGSTHRDEDVTCLCDARRIRAIDARPREARAEVADALVKGHADRNFAVGVAGWRLAHEDLAEFADRGPRLSIPGTEKR